MNTTPRASKRLSPLGIGITAGLAVAVVAGIFYFVMPHPYVPDGEVPDVVPDPFIARLDKVRGFDIAYVGGDKLLVRAVVSDVNTTGSYYTDVADMMRGVGDALRDGSHPPIKTIEMHVRQASMHPGQDYTVTSLAVFTFPAAELENARTLSDPQALDMITAFTPESQQAVQIGAYYCEHDGKAARHFCGLLAKSGK